MNFSFYIEKLFDSKELKEFLKENPKAYPCSGFFVRDFENTKNPGNQASIDYFIPKDKKILSFKMDEGVEKVPVDNPSEENLNKISLDYNFDFSEMEDLIFEEIEKREMKNKVQKMLFSMQNIEGKDYFVGTVFVSGMGLLKVNIDLSEKKITNFEKKSFFDIVNVFKK